MSKKLVSIAIVLTMLLTLISSSVASASSEVTYGYRYGKVQSVAADSFTILQFNKAVKTIQVTSTTNYFGVAGARLSLSNVTPGTWVLVNGTIDSAKNLTATDVILVTKKYAGKTYWNDTREYGTVISVNPAYGVVFMKNSNGDLVKLIGYQPTRFLNAKVNTVAKIKEGMKVAVTGPVQSNGYILAKVIIAFTPAKR